MTVYQGGGGVNDDDDDDDDVDVDNNNINDAQPIRDWYSTQLEISN